MQYFVLWVLGKKAYLRPVLEPFPRWEALKERLSDIIHETQGAVAGDLEKLAASILVVCKERSLADQLKIAMKGNILARDAESGNLWSS